LGSEALAASGAGLLVGGRVIAEWATVADQLAAVRARPLERAELAAGEGRSLRPPGPRVMSASSRSVPRRLADAA
jgi:hypothetical protein